MPLRAVPLTESDYFADVCDLLYLFAPPGIETSRMSVEDADDEDGLFESMDVLWSLGIRDTERFVSIVTVAGCDDVRDLITRMRRAYVDAVGAMMYAGSSVATAVDDVLAVVYLMEPLVQERAGLFHVAAFNLAVRRLDNAGLRLPHDGDVALHYRVSDPLATTEERADALRRLIRRPDTDGPPPNASGEWAAPLGGGPPDSDPEGVGGGPESGESGA